MRNKPILVLFAMAIIMAVGAMAATEYIDTQMDFNIESVTAFTLTLPGELAVESSPTGVSTAAVEFNVTTGTQANVNPCVVGGICQNSTTPIFSYDNTGTVNINISVVMTSAPIGCIVTQGGTSYPGSTTLDNAANVTVVNGFTPAASAQNWFMNADFTSCGAGDSGSRTLRSYGLT